ncbi:hypothetical protein Tco_0183741 [Tanacetum coccineum]
MTVKGSYNTKTGALENFRKQSQIEIIKLQHTVDEHSRENHKRNSHDTPGIDCYSLILIISNLSWWKAIYHDAIQGALGVMFARVTDLANAHGMAALAQVQTLLTV